MHALKVLLLLCAMVAHSWAQPNGASEDVPMATTAAMTKFTFSDEAIKSVQDYIALHPLPTTEDGDLDATPKIAFGQPAYDGQFPYITSLQLTMEGKPYTHICGGALIDRNLILTAAHCLFVPGYFFPPQMVLVGATSIAGESNAKERFAVAEAYYVPTYDHNQWKTKSADNDMAIIRIQGLSNQPLVTLSEYDPAVGASITAAGWGADQNYVYTKTSPTDLQYTQMAVSTPGTNAPCPAIAPGVICTAGQYIGTGPTSTCQGDSGGPHVLTDTSTLVGVTSYGPGTVEQCGTNTYQGITSVAYFLNSFIRPTIAAYGSLSGNVDLPGVSPSPDPWGTQPDYWDDIFGYLWDNLWSYNDMWGGNLYGYSAALPSSLENGNCDVQIGVKDNKRLEIEFETGMKVKAKGPKSCARACSQTRDCNAFNFEHKNKHCTLFSVDTTLGVKAVDDGGFTAGHLFCGKKATATAEATTDLEFKVKPMRKMLR